FELRSCAPRQTMSKTVEEAGICQENDGLSMAIRQRQSIRSGTPAEFLGLTVFAAACYFFGMNRFLHGVARAVAETFDLPEPILEVGSYQVPGQQGLANLRGLFAGKEYIGVDARAGPGVDCIADVEALPCADS